MMPKGQQGQFYGQWPQQPYMADQLPNNRGYQMDRQGYPSNEDLRTQDRMGGPRFVNPFIQPNFPPMPELSRGSSFAKSKKSVTKPKAVTARSKANMQQGDLLDNETIEAIRSIKDDVAYLERDLAYTFKNYRSIVPFYKLPRPPKEVDAVSIKSTRPPTPSETTNKPKAEPKKSNKYIQNYFEKYEADTIGSQKRSADLTAGYPEREFASTIPKSTKPPENKTASKPKKTSQDLYKRAQVATNDSMSFDGQSRPRDQHQTLTMDQEGINFDSNVHSLRNSEMSRVSTGSRRRESFENFKKQYFKDTSIRQNVMPVQSVVKKFTR